MGRKINIDVELHLPGQTEGQPNEKDPSSFGTAFVKQHRKSMDDIMERNSGAAGIRSEPANQHYCRAWAALQGFKGDHGIEAASQMHVSIATPRSTW
jgi:hypothetical protein